MKDYYNLIPDKTRLLTRHFTKGRGGTKPNLIVRHHFAGIGDTDWLWRVWQDRAASAHYGIESGTAIVGQLVYDDNTAWHAANALINARSYGLEHGNITGRVGGRDDHPDSWKIHDDTIKAGARLAAALCLKDGMGKPEWGKNVTDHKVHYGTSCPLKLARGGIYDQPLFDEATWFYDQLDKKLVHPDGTPIKMNFAPPEKGTMMADFDTKTTAMDGTVHTYGQLARYTDGRVFTMETETLPRLEEKLDVILENQKKILGKGGSK